MPVPAPPESARPSGSESQLAPSVRRLVAEKNLDPALIPGTGPGRRITKGDVVLYLENGQPAVSAAMSDPAAMSPIRQRIAVRLLEAKHSTAMLTTFNEIDMSNLMAIRKQYKEAFKQKYGVNLGMMSFFIKAGVEALKELPQVNAFIDGKDIIEHHYYHIGVAVGSERGLVVPVIRYADKLSFAGLEQAIVDYVKKIQENRLEISDLEGGTFTISNGGVYGSLLSTPILNTPQSAILGMHKIEKRPVVIDDEIVIRPMMYVALSYDHRIVDGREAVTFLKRIKEFVENPERMMMEI
jgi:2-oxoglutarate dehydrogenase E2 component (dihydrolipoamide succinyltransferase)